MSPETTRKFALGQTVATPGALCELFNRDVNVNALLTRHVTGDWGDLSEDDRAQNEAALLTGCRILSSYLVGEDRFKVWIITEADRSSTCILLPSEY